MTKPKKTPTIRACCPKCGTKFMQPIVGRTRTPDEKREYYRDYSREYQRGRGAQARTLPIDEIQEAMRITRETGIVIAGALGGPVPRRRLLQLVRWLEKFSVPHAKSIGRRGVDGVKVPAIPHEALDRLVYGKPQRSGRR